MKNNNFSQLTKKSIAYNIQLKTGFPLTYSLEVIDDLIISLKTLIKSQKVNIKNFGNFKIIYKNERMGRNPLTRQNYKISARKSLSFYTSKKLNTDINSL